MKNPAHGDEHGHLRNRETKYRSSVRSHGRRKQGECWEKGKQYVRPPQARRASGRFPSETQSFDSGESSSILSSRRALRTTLFFIWYQTPDVLSIPLPENLAFDFWENLLQN